MTATGLRAMTLITATMLLAPGATPDARAQRGPDIRSLEVGSAMEQVALDAVSIPEGMGALLVPSSSRPELEPHVRAFRGDELAGRGETGRRLILPPGRYRVVVGQGPMAWRARRDADVVAGRTTVAADFVGALRVTAASETEARPRAVSYIVVSADKKRVYGPQTTTESAEYGKTRTWLLAPGAYRVVPGTDPDSPRGAAVFVPANGRVRVRMLVDAGGEVLGTEPEEYALSAERPAWRINWVVGGSVAFGQSEGQLGAFSGRSAQLEAFTELDVQYDRNDHVASFGFGLENSWVVLEQGFGRGLPLQKLDDSARIDVGYQYRLARIVGPYVRASARTSLLPTRLFPDAPYEVVTVAADQTESTESVDRGDEIELMPWVAPVVVQEGVGISLTAWDGPSFGFGVRGGFAGRQLFYRDGGRYVREQSADRLVLGTLTDTTDWGPEVGAWLRASISGWMHVKTELVGFAPVQATFLGEEDFRPVFEWTSSVSLRLNDWASVVYRAVLHRDDERLSDLQFRHSVNLRFHYAIF